MALIVNNAEIVISVGMFMIGTDGVFEALLRLFVTLHHQLADSDFVEHGRAVRISLERSLIVIDGVEIVLVPAQVIPARFQLLRRSARSRRFGAMQRRRTNL